MTESDDFVDLVHLSASLIDPKQEHPAEDRLRTAVPAALLAIGHAPLERIIEFVRSARAAGLQFRGTDEEIARAIQARTTTQGDPKNVQE